MNQTQKIQPRWRRPVRILLWLGGTLFLCVLMAPHVFAGMFAKYDDPARLGAEVYVTTNGGFTVRWAEKPATNPQLTLVFLHGSPGGAGVWASQFQAPYPGATLLAYDRPGFGRSLPALAQPHLQEQVDALWSWLPGATTNRVLLVGHSYGSPIALLAALEHPEKIAGVLLIGGDVDPAQEKPWLVQYFFGWRVTSWLLPHSLRQCNREMLTVGGDLQKLHALLPQLKVPVVMLHGDLDPLVPVENVAWLEQQLTGLGKQRLFARRILPGVNHFIPWEHPDEVAHAIGMLVKLAVLPPSNGRHVSGAI